MQLKNIAEQKDFIRGRQPRILYLDIEVSPMLVYTYSAYEGNALQIKTQPHIVSFAWQWEGEKMIHTRVLPDYKGYKPGVSQLNDKKLITELRDVMEEADVLVGHNMKKFDLKHAKARFIYHDLPVTKKHIVEDTLFMARKYFKFPKNNLDQLCRQFNIGDKSKIKHSDVIFDCLDGDKKAWKYMALYNIQDIKLTRALYKKLAPWHETHYNLNIITRNNGCPVCGGKGNKRGVHRKKAGVFQKYQCKECFKWWIGEKIARAPRAEELQTFTERVDQSNP